MDLITNLCTAGMTFGLGLFAALMIFSPGSLTALGWAIFGPLFLGSTGHFAFSIYNVAVDIKDMVAERKANKAVNTPADEVNQKKPGTGEPKPEAGGQS